MADDEAQPAALDLAHAALSEAIASIDASMAYERDSDARRSLRTAGNRQFELAGRCAAVSIAERLVTLNEHGIETYQTDGDGHRKGI